MISGRGAATPSAPRTAARPYYPVMLNLRGRIAVIVGGGNVAEQKVDALIGAGARVRVIAPELTARLERQAQIGEIEVVRRVYASGDLLGAALAIAATDDRSTNAAIWHEAEGMGVLLNAVDDVDHCHFIAPSVHREGPITVTVSTGGACPTLAVRLRERIGRFIAREHADFAEMAGALRESINARISEPAARRRMWYDIVDSAAIAELRAGRRERALAAVEAAVRAAEGRATDVRAVDAEQVSGPAGIRPAGRVSIVGAGPGDPGLITAHGLRLLAAADVVVHDGLVNAALLMHAGPGARIISVAKRGHGPSTDQDAINRILVDEAMRGRAVVRLKGGDPFVFGRCVEEITALRHAGIPYDVVPGVTAAVAAPAAAGIPVTARDVASGFTVVTAREVDPGGADGEGAVDWAVAAKAPTLVVMMGLQALPAVTMRLQAEGRAASTPAAVISNATLPEQRVVTGTLDSIAVAVAAARLPQPATLIVGDVVNLRVVA